MLNWEGTPREARKIFEDIFEFLNGEGIARSANIFENIVEFLKREGIPREAWNFFRAFLNSLSGKTLREASFF